MRINKEEFSVTYDDVELKIEPTVLRLSSIKIRLVTQGIYIKDPRTVPKELEEENIFWRHLSPDVTAVTESGEEIPVYFSNIENQVEITTENIHPKDHVGRP